MERYSSTREEELVITYKEPFVPSSRIEPRSHVQVCICEPLLNEDGQPVTDGMSKVIRTTRPIEYFVTAKEADNR